jgi:type III secretion protein V
LDASSTNSTLSAASFARSSDLVLAFFIVAIIGLMILPLPTVLIDTLVAANITLGVMLLLMAIYVSSALQFSSFPSVLLISTLFRLALSVATTRMILLDGDAGNIIDTFGEMVAGGNIVVGLVVFLIITLVQFIVIAKGSERVAEVGARFTLDAMPGKQLSIDSDLRSGLIDKAEARKKRADLEQESQLHGSLDGAMKFVKGDAIAGIVVIIVNLLGGLAIGIFQHGMPAAAAIEKYSILTIGDGLVAQIPALFGAMSAGLIVTRVSETDSKDHLGDTIQRQFASIPRVSLVAGVMALLFAFVPGFPTSIFITLGLVLTLTGAMLFPAFRYLMKSYSEPALESLSPRGKRSIRSDVESTEVVMPKSAQPLMLKLPVEMASAGGDGRIRERMQHLIENHCERSGIELPSMHFVWDRSGESVWSLAIFDVPVAGGPAVAGDIDSIVDNCLLSIRRNVKLFVGIQETSRLMAQVSMTAPEVVNEVQRALPLQGISVIFRNLVEEEVPVHHSVAIFEGLVQASQNEKDLSNLTEYARMAIGRQICHRYALDGKVPAVGLTFESEEALLNQVRSANGVTELAANPEQLMKCRDMLGEAIVSEKPQAVVVPVMLRRHIRQLLVGEHFDTPVLSYPEIVHPFELISLKRVDVRVSQP